MRRVGQAPVCFLQNEENREGLTLIKGRKCGMTCWFKKYCVTYIVHLTWNAVQHQPNSLREVSYV